MSKMISIVITSYNKELFIDRAIRSCLNQLLFSKQKEVIVVDDNSTDQTLVKIREFEDEVKIILNDMNYGVAYTSNVGLSESTGEYWIRVDADDYLSMHACEFMSAILIYNPDIDFVYTDHIRVDYLGNTIKRVYLSTDEKLYEHGAGIMFRKEKLIEIGGYSNVFRNCEDYDLLIRLKKNGAKGYYLPIPLYKYYIHGNNITLDDSREAYKQLVRQRNGL